MKTFEFKDYTLDLSVAEQEFQVHCDLDLAEKIQPHHKALVKLGEQILAEEKTSADAIVLCEEILDDILGDGAFDRIFVDREPTLTDVSDVLRFVIGEITEFMQKKTAGDKSGGKNIVCFYF